MKIDIYPKPDEPTINGRIYPRDALKKAWEEYMLGNRLITVGFPDKDCVLDLKDIVGKILSIDDNICVSEIEIFNAQSRKFFIEHMKNNNQNIEDNYVLSFKCFANVENDIVSNVKIFYTTLLNKKDVGLE